MTAAELQTIEEIFRTANELPPERVSTFLERACDGDELLRHKVEALLASRETAARYMETSAAGLATRVIQAELTRSLVGKVIGHYKVTELIGTGGMGEVYLATDIVAGRNAALKVLAFHFSSDAARLKRFEREARAVVGLNHPNIVTVYEIGEDHSVRYIASELIEGETLRARLARGPMQLSEALDVAIQVTSALAAAHQMGIVHRDIKPENVMLRPDGYVKVLDFGIAKLAESALTEATTEAESVTLGQTNLGSILGTVGYMSPEQARAAQVDKRSDIWSLGVVIYEIVTGRAPFTGNTPGAVMSAILEKEPSPLTNYLARAPAELQRIVSKMLRKNRDERYPDANELLDALKHLRRRLEAESERAATALWLRRARSPTVLVLVLIIAVLAVALPFYRHRKRATNSPANKSIAVLPLANLSQEKENAFFADGIHDQLLSNLSKIKDLKVISRTSVMPYKNGPSRNLKKIARQLGVSNVVEGSVLRSGDHVRVSVQLIDGQTDRHLWGHIYDRTLSDSLRLQGELATEITAAVGATLTPHEKVQIEAKPTNNPAAYDAYLRARAFPSAWAYYLQSDLKDAIRLYQKAVNLDPKFTLAWAHLSIAQSKSYSIGVDPGSLRLKAAKDALDRALALDPSLPEVHLARGYYLYGERDNTGALAEFRQAEQSFPNSTDVIEAIAMAQKALGNWDESLAELRRAIELDPRNVTASNNLALTYGDLRRFPEALATLDRVFAWDPTNARALLTKVEIFLAMGDLEAVEPLLAKSSVPAGYKATYMVLKRRYTEAAQLLSQAAAVESDQGDLEVIRSLGQAQQLAGDVSAAVGTYQRAVQDLQRQLKTVVPGSFEEAWRHKLLGEVYAGLGEAALAIAEGQRAVAVCPSSINAWGGPIFEANLAEIYAKLGDADHAIPILQRVLQLPCGFSITPALLRLDPTWDRIRDDSRFQELVAQKPP